MITWTIVTRPEGSRGMFRRTDFTGGSWTEAVDYAQSLQDGTVEAYVVPTTDTEVHTDTRTGRVGPVVRIAPTVDERRAAKAEKARVDAIVADLLAADWLREYGYLIRDARVLANVDTDDDATAARALAEAGFDRAALGRRHS